MKQFLHAWPRDAWIILVARALMLGAGSLLVVALVLRVHDAGAGPLANTGVFVALGLPQALLIRPAGLVADRFDSRRVLTVALGVQLLAGLALSASAALPWTYAWAATYQAGQAFANPVWMALIPRVVGEDRVQGLTSAQMVAGSLAGPLGAAAAGFLVEHHGTQSPPAAVAGVAAVVVGLAALVRTRRAGAREAGDTAGGFAIVRRDPVLFTLICGLAVLVMVIQGVNVVEVFLVRDALGASAAEFGAGELFFSGGALVAAIGVARLSTDRRRIAGVLGGFGATALVCLAIGYVPHLPGYFALLVLLGAFNATGNGAMGPLFLLRTPEAARGRVQSVLMGTIFGFGIVGLIAGGTVGAFLGPRVTFVAAGGLGAAVVAAMSVAVAVTGRYRPRHAA